MIDPRYARTWLPTRNGENVAEIHNRLNEFLQAFFTRFDLASSGSPIESDKELDLGRHRSILFMGHAASVIALCRELIGDRNLNQRAGCCSLSILVPKPDAERPSLSSPPSSSLTLDPNHASSASEQGNARPGSWLLIQDAAADFLPNGAEREWGFSDIEINESDHEVVSDVGEADSIGQVEAESERGLQIQFPDGCNWRGGSEEKVGNGSSSRL